MSDGFIMTKGQWLTHENGERYAVANRDIPYHSHLSSSDFTMADGTAPEPHSLVPDDVLRTRMGVIRAACIEGEWVEF